MEMEPEEEMRKEQEEKMRQLYRVPYSNENDDVEDEADDDDEEEVTMNGDGPVMSLVEINGKMYIVPADDGSVWQDKIKEVNRRANLMHYFVAKNQCELTVFSLRWLS